jgi:hypothetical protein
MVGWRSSARWPGRFRRAGTSNLRAVMDLAAGKVIGSSHAQRRAIEFGKFLTTIDRQVAPGLDVHALAGDVSRIIGAPTRVEQVVIVTKGRDAGHPLERPASHLAADA